MYKQRAEEEKARWKKMKDFAEKKDFLSFWKEYKSYIEWANIISNQRRFLYEMICDTIDFIETKKDTY